MDSGTGPELFALYCRVSFRHRRGARTLVEWPVEYCACAGRHPALASRTGLDRAQADQGQAHQPDGRREWHGSWACGVVEDHSRSEIAAAGVESRENVGKQRSFLGDPGREIKGIDIIVAIHLITKQGVGVCRGERDSRVGIAGIRKGEGEQARHDIQGVEIRQIGKISGAVGPERDVTCVGQVKHLSVLIQISDAVAINGAGTGIDGEHLVRPRIHHPQPSVRTEGRATDVASKGVEKNIPGIVV